MREIKTNESSRRKAGYTSPSTRVIDVKLRGGIMVVSPGSTNDPEFKDGGNLLD